MNADMEEQEDELLALNSIFDSEEFVRDRSKSAGEIRVSVELPADFTVTLKEGQYACLDTYGVVVDITTQHVLQYVQESKTITIENETKCYNFSVRTGLYESMRNNM